MKKTLYIKKLSIKATDFTERGNLTIPNDLSLQ